MATRGSNNGANSNIQDNVKSTSSNTTTGAGSFGGSWSENNGFRGMGMSRQTGGERLNGLYEALLEVYKKAPKNLEISLIKVDNSVETRFDFSFIIVALRLAEATGLGVAYHILMVDSGTSVRPLVQNINGRQVEIVRSIEDTMDSTIKEYACRKIAEMFPGLQTYFVDGEAVRASFDFKNEVKLQGLAFNAAAACYNEIRANSDTFTDLSVTHDELRTPLEIEASFRSENHIGIDDNPIRSDVVMTLRTRQVNNNQNRQDFNNGNRVTDHLLTSAFIDYVWIGGRNNNPFMRNNQQANQQKPPQFAPRVVITDIQSDLGLSPSILALAVASATALNADSNWMQSFRPQTGTPDNGVDFKDVGALNIEGNMLGEPSKYAGNVNLKEDGFRLEDLGGYLSNLCVPQVMISMDIPECGPQTWYMALLAAAANNRGNAQAALVASFDALTNGVFSQRFPDNAPLFVDVGQRVHLGYWQDSNGRIRDIRDIDYLAAANTFGIRAPQEITAFADTFMSECGHIDVRMAERWKLIQRITNETAVYTGRAERVTFSRQVIETLISALQAGGVDPRVCTPLSAQDINSRRGVASFYSNAVIGQQASFFGASTNYNNYTGSNTQFNNRW